MKSLKNVVRNFMQLSAEEKALRLVVIGFVGILVGIVANMFGYEYEHLPVNLLLGAFALVFAIGCILVCKSVGKCSELGAKSMILGAFGISAYMTIMFCIGWSVKYIWNVDIWSDVPGIMSLHTVVASLGVILFFVGLVRLIASNFRRG